VVPNLLIPRAAFTTPKDVGSQKKIDAFY